MRSPSRSFSPSIGRMNKTWLTWIYILVAVSDEPTSEFLLRLPWSARLHAFHQMEADNKKSIKKLRKKLASYPESFPFKNICNEMDLLVIKYSTFDKSYEIRIYMQLRCTRSKFNNDRVLMWSCVNRNIRFLNLEKYILNFFVKKDATIY